MVPQPDLVRVFEALIVGGESRAGVEAASILTRIGSALWPSSLSICLGRRLATHWTATRTMRTALGRRHSPRLLCCRGAVGRLLLSGMQTRVVASIVPGHHHVLEVFILDCRPSVSRQLVKSSPQSPETAAVKLATTYRFPESPVAWHWQEVRQHLVPAQPWVSTIGHAEVFAARSVVVPDSS